jgi:transcriptional regulator with XRE-family HTH domain
VSEDGEQYGGIGARIKAVRSRKRLNVSALARLVDVTHTAINHIENGSRNPSRELVFKIAEVTGSSVAELMGAERGVQYVAMDPKRGFLETKPVEEWPDCIKGPTPEEWPGTLRSFIASVGADLMRLIPEEVPLLARMGQVGPPPTDEDGWIATLTMLRMLIGAGGRPVLWAMIKADEGGGD